MGRFVVCSPVEPIIHSWIVQPMNRVTLCCVQLTMCIFYTIVFLELAEQQRVCYEKLKAVKS